LRRPRTLSLSAFLSPISRRHTRSKRDWSSDVCSSDLRTEKTGAARPPQEGEPLCLRLPGFLPKSPASFPSNVFPPTKPRGLPLRSEERRVGRGCRAQEGRQQREPADEAKATRDSRRHA